MKQTDPVVIQTQQIPFLLFSSFNDIVLPNIIFSLDVFFRVHALYLCTLSLYVSKKGSIT